MGKIMKVRFLICLLVSLALLLPAIAGQNSAQELPSAPSAARQRSSSQPAPPSGEPAPQSKPAAIDAPARNDATPSTSAQSSDPQNAAPKAPDQASVPQAEAPPADDSITTIRKTVNEVHVVFTVTDKHGRYIKDLKKDDFKIVDDSKPPEEIRSFRSETDLPLQVGLLIDASNSVRDRFKFEQEAAIEFLNQTIHPKYDEAFVVGFDVTPEVTQDFTGNTEKLSIGIRSLRPGGGTAMFDALYFACRDKLMKQPQAGPTRRAIILLSDGDDNQSHVSREEAIEMAQRAEVVVYTISTNLTGASSQGDKILARIAEATGGRAYVPFQITEVANAFGAIQEELRSQYAIGYKPADFRADGHYRTIEILAVNQKGLHIRNRHGYYAPSR
jgi:Ca-activated chloride channel family protein